MNSNELLKLDFCLLLQAYISRSQVKPRNALKVTDTARFIDPVCLSETDLDKQMYEFYSYVLNVAAKKDPEQPDWLVFLKKMARSPDELYWDFMFLLQTYVTAHAHLTARNVVAVLDQARFLNRHIFINENLDQQVVEFTVFMTANRERPDWVVWRDDASRDSREGARSADSETREGQGP